MIWAMLFAAWGVGLLAGVAVTSISAKSSMQSALDDQKETLKSQIFNACHGVMLPANQKNHNVWNGAIWAVLDAIKEL